MLKYKCLVLDHDDTVVKTTAQIHYPSFKKTIEEIKPWITVTEKDFLLNCFDPGFFIYMKVKLGFTDEEMTYQLNSWLKYMEDKIPAAYDGIDEIIRRQKDEGGLVCVVSHSYSEIIMRDYEKHFGILPDAIFGGEETEEKRKPSPYPLFEIERRFDLANKDLVVIDDLKPGLDMANAANVDFICAGWSHTVKEISDFMQANCSAYLRNVEELKEILFRQ